MKSELYVHAVEFRKQAEKVWSEATAYPGQFDANNVSRGQCGISSFGLGLWLVQKKAWNEQELAFARGLLLDSEGKIIDDNHCWLEVAHKDVRWQVDVTPDQYPGVTDLLVMQEKGSFDTTLWHATEQATPLDEYDIAKFGGRLAVFAEAMGITV